jgi:hypothetical protein
MSLEGVTASGLCEMNGAWVAGKSGVAEADTHPFAPRRPNVYSWSPRTTLPIGPRLAYNRPLPSAEAWAYFHVPLGAPASNPCLSTGETCS